MKMMLTSANMEGVRLVARLPRFERIKSGRIALLIIILMAFTSFSPVATANSSALKTDDFGVLDKLHEINSANYVGDGQEAAPIATNAILDGINQRERASGINDPFGENSTNLENLILSDTTPNTPNHPTPYQMLKNPQQKPAGLPASLWETLAPWGIDNYVIVTNYTGGILNEHILFSNASFYGELIAFPPNPFNNQIDIDGVDFNLDGVCDFSCDADIEVTLTISFIPDNTDLELGKGETWDIIDNFGNPWPYDGNIFDISTGVPAQLWIKPTITYSVTALGNSVGLDVLEHLEISLLKGFTYDQSVGSEIGESYVWTIDSKFTQAPNNFELNVGLERVTLNITDTTLSAVDAAAGGLLSLLGVFEGTSELSLAMLASPYSLNIVNNGQKTCRAEYTPEQRLLPSEEQDCGISVGLGYVHYPSGEEPEEILEMAYIEASFHPSGNSSIPCSNIPIRYCLPEEVDLIIRNDNLGENGLDTIEFWSERETDLRIHYFEDRSNMQDGEEYGNITEAIGWIRKLPSQSFEPDEIDRIYRMLGYDNEIELPGQRPSRLSFILGIKNFSRDNSQNNNDPTLPINPHSSTRPDTLVLIASKTKIEQLDYRSWFQRYGNESDHRKIDFVLTDIPEVIILHGSFELGGGSENINVPDDPSLSAFSQLLDGAIITIVDVIINIGSILNSLPDALTETSSSKGGEINIEMMNSVRESRFQRYLGEIKILFGSSSHPTLSEDHFMITKDTDLDFVSGRLGNITPLTRVGLSAKFSGISNLHYTFDAISDERKIEIDMTEGEKFRFAYLEHEKNSVNSSAFQSALLSERPRNLTIMQNSEKMSYSANTGISSLVYHAESGKQKNALKLEGLPKEFEILLGDEVGYNSAEPLGSIAIQISNASNDFVLDGDHAYHWQNGDIGESSLSVRISNLLTASWRSPENPGASGVDGLARIKLIRPEGTTFNAKLIDETTYNNDHLGLNATIQISPLPGNLEIDVPTDDSSDSLILPNFGDESGINGISNFLGGLIGFGTGVNDLVGNLTRDFLGPKPGDINASLVLNLQSDEEFDVLVELEKGDNVKDEPDWVHGISAIFEERTVLDLNLTKLNFTEESGNDLIDILKDEKINSDEHVRFLQLMENRMIEPDIFSGIMRDGWINSEELKVLDIERLKESGISLRDERSYHIKAWIPRVAPIVEMSYFYFVEGEIPQWSLDLKMTDWKPKYSDFTIKVDGLEGMNLNINLDGFDTTRAIDVEIGMFMSTDSTLIVPRIYTDMSFNLGSELDYVQINMLDKVLKQRVSTLIVDIPSKANFAATIGDVLIMDLAVPAPGGSISASTSVDAIMITMARYLDNQWWPTTAFMRDLPGELHLETGPSKEFDITKETSFQGVNTLDYTSNGNEMDLYIYASGRAINSRSNILMLAEDMPSTTSIKHTENWGMKIESYPNGIKRFYLKQSDTPIQPGVYLKSSEILGENLKSATVHAYYIANLYPFGVISDVSGGKIIATGNVEADFGGIKWDAKGVLIDAQVTGIIPSASTFGINGIGNDLSILNSVTNGRGTTTHFVFPEPISSGVLTLLYTIF
tara:strand:+ start:1689 stop:6401 length:4713 start_codon:yes stop_codon:yes gene_type:complete